MIQHPSKHLTSNYEKGKDSNNYKLLSLGHIEHEEILKNLNAIEAFRDMDNATGYTLDKIGKNVLELRNGRDDKTYRRAIKIKIIGNLSAGTIEELNTIGEILFGNDFISVQETWSNDLYDREPAALFLSQKDNPDDQYMYFEYIRTLVSAVKAGGVRLYNRIYTVIPEGNVHIGAVLSNDLSRMHIPPRLLTDLVIPGVDVNIKAAASADISDMFIPNRTLTDMKVSSVLHCVGFVTVDYACLRIPTAILRED